MKAKLIHEKPAGAHKIVVRAFLEQWLQESVKPNVRPNTFTLYKFLVSRYIAPVLGTVKLIELCSKHIRSFYADLEAGGASKRMVEMIHTRLNRAMKCAVLDELIPRNPCEGVKPAKRQRPTYTALDSAQSRALLNAAQGSPLHALYVLAITTGMRQGELLALQWRDFDDKNATLSVRHTLQELNGTLLLCEPKTNSSRRSIRLPYIAIAALKEHKRKWGGYASDYIFTDARGGPLRKSNLIRRSFKPLLASAGLPNIRFHDLRHTATTLMLSVGVHPKVVQERLGHASIALTLDTYSHVLPTLQNEAANKIDELLGDS